MNEERKNQQAAAEPSLSEILQVRRDKLKALQDAGRDPFVQTRFERSAYSADIKNDFDAYDGKTLQAAGRIMSKRGMGKAIFCDIQDDRGQIQLYVRKDAVTELPTVPSGFSTPGLRQPSLRGRKGRPESFFPFASATPRSCRNACRSWRRHRSGFPSAGRL